MSKDWKFSDYDNYDKDPYHAAMCKRCGVSPEEDRETTQRYTERMNSTGGLKLPCNTKGELVNLINKYNSQTNYASEDINLYAVLRALGIE